MMVPRENVAMEISIAWEARTFLAHARLRAFQIRFQARFQTRFQ